MVIFCAVLSIFFPKRIFLKIDVKLPHLWGGSCISGNLSTDPHPETSILALSLFSQRVHAIWSDPGDVIIQVIWDILYLFLYLTKSLQSWTNIKHDHPLSLGKFECSGASVGRQAFLKEKRNCICASHVIFFYFYFLSIQSGKTGKTMKVHVTASYFWDFQKPLAVPGRRCCCCDKAAEERRAGRGLCSSPCSLLKDTGSSAHCFSWECPCKITESFHPLFPL